MRVNEFSTSLPLFVSAIRIERGLHMVFFSESDFRLLSLIEIDFRAGNQVDSPPEDCSR